MKTPLLLIFAISIAALGPSCTSSIEQGSAKGNTQNEIYEQCLRDNQPVATAWHLIEEQCRDLAVN